MISICYCVRIIDSAMIIICNTCDISWWNNNIWVVIVPAVLRFTGILVTKRSIDDSSGPERSDGHSVRWHIPYKIFVVVISIINLRPASKFNYRREWNTQPRHLKCFFFFEILQLVHQSWYAMGNFIIRTASLFVYESLLCSGRQCRLWRKISKQSFLSRIAANLCYMSLKHVRMITRKAGMNKEASILSLDARYYHSKVFNFPEI